MTHSKRILVIEDDNDIREIICEALKLAFPQGELTALTSGAEFEKTFSTSQDWNLIVLDILLPGITGIDICNQIRKKDVAGRIPILALTASDTPDWEKKSRLAGVNHYMAKPFDMGEFIKVAKDLMT